MHCLPAESGLRERKKRARREALVDATHRLVAEHGLDGVTVEAICADVGVSTRTFFNYFESKDDAVLGIGPWEIDPDAAETFATGGPTGELLADLQVLAGHVLAHPTLGHERMSTVLELTHREPRLLQRHMTWMDQHRSAVEELVVRRQQHTGAPGRGADVVAMLLLLLAHGSCVRREAAHGEGSTTDHLAGFVDDLRHVLGTATS
ncbi:TetR/AcrR family transcriptional regulator [Cellulomonas sp. P22]|uniref:TetR/AcrR family transcriptional regulator n=1 Tax=Cellulomonas sp. P22 TaxID=3373189 RepID=UPI0037A439A2